MTCVFLQSQVIEKLLMGDDDDDVLEKLLFLKQDIWVMQEGRRKKVWIWNEYNLYLLGLKLIDDFWLYGNQMQFREIFFPLFRCLENCTKIPTYFFLDTIISRRQKVILPLKISHFAKTAPYSLTLYTQISR